MISASAVIWFLKKWGSATLPGRCCHLPGRVVTTMKKIIYRNCPLHTKRTTTSFYEKLLQHPLCTERAERLGAPPLLLVTPRVAFRVARSLGATLGKLLKNGDTPNPEHILQNKH